MKDSPRHHPGPQPPLRRSAAVPGRSIIHHYRRPQAALMCALFTFAAFSSPRVFAQYTIIDWGTNYPRGINNQGQIVGDFSPGLSLGGDYWGGNAINESGQLAGFAYTPGGLQQHALSYSNGVITDLGNLGAPFSEPYSINNLGQIVGQSSDGMHTRAFLYENGGMQPLGTLGGPYDSVAWCINDSGQIVGRADAGVPGRSAYHAFRYSGGVMKDLGTLGADPSSANGINNNGNIVGQSYLASNSVYHAFLYNGGVMKDLGTLGGADSAASRINNKGQVVGYSYTPDYSTHAFLYSDGVMWDLNSLVSSNSGWILDSPFGINDRGEIICIGKNAAGQTHGMLLRPTATLSISLATNYVTVSWPQTLLPASRCKPIRVCSRRIGATSQRE